MRILFIVPYTPNLVRVRPYYLIRALATAGHELTLLCVYENEGERQQAKALELRAAMSLSRLWQCQRRRKEARQVLAEVYGWFTEGFDTPDLLEAKMLLEALSSD